MSSATQDAIAVIPARGGSKGIPGKNLRTLGGVPLIGRTVLAARNSARANSVYVSSDSAEILGAAAQYGAKGIQRPEDLSTDTASSEAALLHALSYLGEQGVRPRVLVFLQCTSPFTTSAEIDRLVAALDDGKFNSALTVIEDHSFLWGLNSGGEGVGTNHDQTAPRKMRQELPPQFRETGAGYAMRVNEFLRTKRRFCAPVKPVLTEHPPFEIDSLADFAVAEAFLAKSGRAR